MIERLFFNTLEISLSTSLVILLLLLFSKAMGKAYSAKLKYWIWLFVALRLIIPLNLSLPTALLTVKAPIQEIYVAGDILTSPITVGTSDKVIEQAPAKHAVSITDIASYVWVFGMVLFLLYHIRGYYLFLRKIKRQKIIIDSTLINEIYTHLMTKMSMRCSPAIYQCSEVDSPMLVGFFHPCILLPAQEYPENELKIILKHELVHACRSDLWYKFLLLLANAVHWFNPLIYITVKQATADLECACDEEVLQDTTLEYRRDYGKTMLGVMRKGLKQQTTLSTHFSPGKKAVKQRFARILDTGKKRRGFAVLCATVLLISLAGLLVASQNIGEATISPGTAYSRKMSGEHINWYDTGCAYSLDVDGNVIISYNDGETTVQAPISINSSSGGNESVQTEKEAGFYISESKTAIAYGGLYGKPIYILISDDMGKNWYISEISVEEIGVSWQCIGFTTKDDGWLVVCNFHGMGNESHFIYKTADGGKTWMAVEGNINEVYSRMLSGAGFANDEIGFLCFRYETDFQPAICMTKDGGLSWNAIYIDLPEEFDEYNKTPLSPVFEGKNGILPVLLSNENGDADTIYLTSNNYGKTWAYKSGSG